MVSASRVEDPWFESHSRLDFSGIESNQWLKNWHSSGYPGGIGSVLRLVGPVSVYYEWVRCKVWSATYISVWQYVKLSEQICPWDTLACCWDVKQPTNKQTAEYLHHPSWVFRDLGHQDILTLISSQTVEIQLVVEVGGCLCPVRFALRHRIPLSHHFHTVKGIQITFLSKSVA